MSTFKIGWAEESIVPAKKAQLPGQLYERISEYVESDITVTAMAIEAGEEKAVLISADLVHIGAELFRKVRERLAKICPDLPSSALIMGATHTHTSLQYYENGVASINMLNEFLPEGKKYTPIVQADPDTLTPAEALELIVEKTVAAAAKAWTGREEAMMTHTFGRAAVGFCRFTFELQTGLTQSFKNL